mmetsp:Transcript_67148/g.132222  ORF Transcript_67148/g.132222 Transcript_67148/m.132222 type:complete len:219 (+) Transcript_67148:3-659(+)
MCHDKSHPGLCDVDCDFACRRPAPAHSCPLVTSGRYRRLGVGGKRRHSGPSHSGMPPMDMYVSPTQLPHADAGKERNGDLHDTVASAIPFGDNRGPCGIVRALAATDGYAAAEHSIVEDQREAQEKHRHEQQWRRLGAPGRGAGAPAVDGKSFGGAASDIGENAVSREVASANKDGGAIDWFLTPSRIHGLHRFRTNAVASGANVQPVVDGGERHGCL